LGIPEPDGAVRAGRGQEVAVPGVEGHGADLDGMATQGKATRVRLAIARHGIPHLHGAVVTGRDEPVAVGAERYAADGVEVAAQGYGFLGSLWIPEFHGPFRTAQGQAPAVGAEGRVRPAVQAEQLLAGLAVPDFYFHVRAGPTPGRRGQVAAVGTE